MFFLAALVALASAAPPVVAPAPALPAPVAPATGPLPPHQVFPDVVAAMDVVLAENPHILGIGELHSTTATANVPSTLAVFTHELFPLLAPHLTDLVLETWRVDGTCGEPAAAVTAEVETQTERPPETKSDLAVLVEAAVAAKVRPHDLAFSCDEYKGLRGTDGEVQFGALLGLLTDKLQDYGVRAATTPGVTMVLYGGAVHNDLAPRPELARYSYATAVAAKAGKDYVELDLVQPELLTPTMTEPAWAPLLPTTGPDHVVLFERAPRSFVILLPTAGPVTTPAPAPPPSPGATPAEPSKG